MREAAEDASCNTIPTHNPPTPLCLHLYPKRAQTWGDVRNRRKPAGRFAVCSLVGAWGKKHMGIVYTNGLHKCATARQNMESEPLRERKTVLFGMFEHVHSADETASMSSWQIEQLQVNY